MIEIIPAILTNDPAELEAKLKQLEGVVRRVQVDIVDGVFADNKTVSPEILETADTSLYLDLHLMTKEPTDWIEKSVRAMADRIIGQVEMMGDQAEFVNKVIEAGAQGGLAIDIDTSVSTINPDILNTLDLVLVMSVKAGFGNQDFDERALEKIKELDEIRSKETMKYKICADGGINIMTIRAVADAGADEAVVGHFIFNEDVQRNIDLLQKEIDLFPVK